MFDGATGKVLKDGGAPFSGAYADLSGKPSLGGAAALNVGTTAGTVAAGDDARFSAGGSSKNEAIFALEIADLKGSRLGMVGGVADAFDDESGVNVGGSTNQSYDAANDWYVPVAVESSQISPPLTSNTGVGVTVSASTVYGAGQEAWRAADDDSTDTHWHSGNVALPATWYSTFSTARRLTSYRLRWRAATSARPTAWEISGSNDNSSWTVVDTRTGQSPNPNAGGTLYKIATPGSYLYYRIVFTASDNTFASMRNIQLNVDSALNMSLVSTAYPTPMVPPVARIVLQIVPTDAIAINTDVTAEVSRDDGATWTTAALALASSLSGIALYEDNDVNLSSQPSGTSMKWRVKTLNNKNVAVSGVVMQWS
ncbi:discoidin domain-containing protein [Shinella zoogloeoides]|uniref:discoidin domain-containing protein n=1 Tax=Shinella zoogloeoides TaxID=352475 RepID=UPI0013C36FDE|nr:discoidin domain-containing protein [Shinella zoogloeoides]